MPESWQRWYPHDINDWNGSAAVRSFSDAAYRAYHTLLMAQFEQDDGMLPNDPRKLAKLSGMGVRWQEPRAGYPTIAEEVMEEFESGPDDKVYNPRMYKEWLRARKVFEKRSNGGKRKSLPRVIEESSKSLGTVLTKNTEKPEESTTHIQRQRQEQNTNTKPVVPRAREPEPPPEGIVEQIVCAHPKSIARNLQPNEVRQADAVAALEAIEAECEATGASANEASAALLEIMRGFAEKIPRGQWRYLKDPAEFLRCRDYRRKPEEFMREGGIGGSNSTNRAQERVEQSRGAFRKAAERRGIRGIDGFAGPDGGELSPPGPPG